MITRICPFLSRYYAIGSPETDPRHSTISASCSVCGRDHDIVRAYALHHLLKGAHSPSSGLRTHAGPQPRTAWQGMPEGVAPGLLRRPGLCHGRAVGIKKTGLDVGTVRGLFLIRIGDLFVCPDYSALSNTLIRCQVAERAVWAALLIVEPPGFASMIFQEF